MAKRVALLIDSEENLLKIEEGIKFLYEAKVQNIINWVASYICDIFKDPKGFDYAMQELNQIGAEIVLIFSDNENYGGIVLAKLRHEHANMKINVVSVALRKLKLDSVQIFQDFILGNLPETKDNEFEKTKKLAPFEIMNLFPKKYL